MLEEISGWDVHHVVDWLRANNVGKYAKLFEDNHITGDSLLECDQSVLKELGVERVGDRVRIVLAVKNLRSKASGNSKKRNRDTFALLENFNSSSPFSANLANQELMAALNTFTPAPGNSEFRSIQDPRKGIEVSRQPYYYGANSYSRQSNTPQPTDTNKSSGTPPWTRTHAGKSPSIDIMSIDSVKQNCVKFIGYDGTTRIVNISSCVSSIQILAKAIKKFGVSDDPANYCAYSITHSDSSPRLLTDLELVRICLDQNQPERERLILRKRNTSPSVAEVKRAREIAKEQGDYSQTTPREAAAANYQATFKKVEAITGEKAPGIYRNDSSSALSPSETHFSIASSTRPSRQAATQARLRNFFGQRPPSELISSNLAEYFPGHQKEVLEETVRSSLRRSRRLSRAASRASIATTVSYQSSIGTIPPVPSVPSIGDTWLHASNSLSSPISNSNLLSRARPLSVRKALPSTTYADESALGTLAEESPLRKSFVSGFTSESGSSDPRDSIRDSLSVVVTDHDRESYLEGESGTGTPSSERAQSTNISGLIEDADEDDEDTEEEGQDGFETNDGLRWIKGALIGSGSFGSVYLALNAMTGELMAVKQVELPSGSVQGEHRKKNMIDALQREIGFLKDLQHENIVQYFGSTSDEGHLNIFLEYVPGGSVAALLNNYGPFEEPLIRNFIRQVLQGLKYLHERDIIHRDIKGANVLVDNKGGIKISDFGISKKVDTALLSQIGGNHRQSMQGSVFWMAPEVVKQTSYTRKADIWSLGCLVVEMFTGTHPYPSSSQLQAIFKIGSANSRPDIPQKCTTEASLFLAKSFEHDHVKRPTADELLVHPFMNPIVGGGAGASGSHLVTE